MRDRKGIGASMVFLAAIILFVNVACGWTLTRREDVEVGDPEIATPTVEEPADETSEPPPTMAPAPTDTTAPTETLAPTATTGEVLVTTPPEVTETADVSATATVEAEPSNSSIVGVGILGASTSDEYQSNDNRGGAYAARTLGWVEQLFLSRQLNFGDWDDWGGPRRTGFEYNWSRSGSDTREMIEEGQHTGLAGQVAGGEVSHVLIFIGSNDFNPTNNSYRDVYDGTMSDAELQAKVDQIVNDITLAADTILNAGDVQMGIVLLVDPAFMPEFRDRFTDAGGRERVGNAIDQINARVEAMAAERGIITIDFETFLSSLLAQVDENGIWTVGGVDITLNGRGDEPHYARLDDREGHPGTVLSGYIANKVFVEPFNEAFNMGVEPLSDDEILRHAGLR